MNDASGNFADETVEMASESEANPGAELRKRRSSRIVQAVPLTVTGVDALGRPFVERTSSLIINCHGCRYQSKHYVLKNMWVTLEIPHHETGQPPRQVRGRVAWIQRPRTVRQLFQVALELELPGNVWGIGFPPEDWGSFAATVVSAGSTRLSDEMVLPLAEKKTQETAASLVPPEMPPAAIGTDRLFNSGFVNTNPETVSKSGFVSTNPETFSKSGFVSTNPETFSKSGFVSTNPETFSKSGFAS